MSSEEMKILGIFGLKGRTTMAPKSLRSRFEVVEREVFTWLIMMMYIFSLGNGATKR